MITKTLILAFATQPGDTRKAGTPAPNLFNGLSSSQGIPASAGNVRTSHSHPRERPRGQSQSVYVGYGSLAASHGVVGVTFDHRLHSVAGYPAAADDIAAAAERARALPGVDPDRVALWFFSGGGPLTADWLSRPPAWLRCLAATYPVLAPLPGRDPGTRFHPVEAVRTVGSLPILLTRVGRERPEIAATVDAFTAQAELHSAKLTVIDVPDGQHGFDTLDHNESSRLAVRQAMTWVVTALRADQAV